MITTSSKVLDGPLTMPTASRKGSFLQTVFTGDVLIVEDNFIIAMDVEELAKELGATHVHLTTNCDDALAVIDKTVVSAAILDFNIGDETSDGVADALSAKDIPFVFATGYSDSSMLPARYQTAVLLKKPYSREDIIAAFQGPSLATE